MTDGQIIKLSEDELDKVSGGDVYKDAYITKCEDGTYSVNLIKFTGSAADYQAIVTLVLGGGVPGLDSNLSITRYAGMSQSSLDKQIPNWEKQGYIIHM